MKNVKLLIDAIRDLLIQFLPYELLKPFINEVDVAFIVHPLDYKDASKKYPFAKYFTNRVIKIWMKYFWPIIGSSITGFVTKEGREIKGWIIICPLTPKIMLQNPILARKKILQSVRFAEKLKCRIAGLGAFTSILTHDGFDLVNKVKNIGLTTGNTYAAALILENINKITMILNIDLQKSTVAIIGAAGSVGSACSAILSYKVKKLILVDINYKILKEIVEKLKGNIKISYQIEDIKEADIVVSVTNTPGAIIQSEHLKHNSIVIDAAQPKNVSEEIPRLRKDVVAIESGIAKAFGIKYNIDLGLKKNEVFACLGETLALSAVNWKEHYSLGKVKPYQIEEISNLVDKIGLTIGDFRNSYGFISNEDILRFKK